MEKDFFTENQLWKNFRQPEINTPHMRRRVSQAL